MADIIRQNAGLPPIDYDDDETTFEEDQPGALGDAGTMMRDIIASQNGAPITPAPDALSGRVANGEQRQVATGQRPRFSDPVNAARDQYRATSPQSTGGKILDALKTAGLGFLQGAASNPNDPIASGIGGAATGGLISAVSPNTGRDLQFEMVKRPEIEAEQRRKREQEKADRDKTEAALEMERIIAQTDKTRAETEALRTPKPITPRAPVRSDRGLYDPEAKAIIPGTEPLPKDKPQALRQAFNGQYYDLNDPQQAVEFRRVQESMPRDGKGRFITRESELSERRERRIASNQIEGDFDAPKWARLSAMNKEGAAGVRKMLRAHEALKKQKYDAIQRKDTKGEGLIDKQIETAIADMQKYGAIIEAGYDKNGWSYAKLRDDEPQSSSQPKLPPGAGKTVTEAELRELAADEGVSFEAMKNTYRRDGYTIKR